MKGEQEEKPNCFTCLFHNLQYWTDNEEETIIGTEFGALIELSYETVTSADRRSEG